MARPPIQSIEISEYLTLSECHPDSECRTINWWLYDTRVGWNICIRAKTKEEALAEGIDYWAQRCLAVEKRYVTLSDQVDSFVSKVRPEENEGE